MAKLPADLPENWTSGQIISPNGTEVGLDAKHGYNYLMKQVNAAQTGVNTLNDNMTGVAQESTLQGVKTDVEALSTSAAKEATLQTVKTDVATVQTGVNNLDTKVGSSTDTGTTTVMGKLNKVVEGAEGNLTNHQRLSCHSNVTASSYTTANISSSPTTVLNITGKGELYYIYIGNTTSGSQSGWWKLLLDDMEVISCESKNYGFIRFGTPLNGQENGSNVQEWNIFQNHNILTASYYRYCVPEFVPQFYQSLKLIYMGAGEGTSINGKFDITYGVVAN
nr:MAG TPA: hypothetical protein [Caudoviricetes sp.]DAK02352.1 MAG TPA: hypothetical protein [Caudoviricetes sp.]